MKVYKRLAFASIILFALLFTTSAYKQFVRVQNVFDQMFYTRIRTHYDWWEGTWGGPGNKITSFQHMPQIKRVSRDTEDEYTNNMFFIDSYNDAYLKDGEQLYLWFNSKNKTILITAEKQFEDSLLTYQYIYNVESKQLKEVIGCWYDKLDSEESNESVNEYKEYTDNLQEILVITEAAGVTRADLIKYKKYFLYDKLLTDWLDANSSRFSVNQWGRVEFEEVLPLEAGA